MENPLARARQDCLHPACFRLNRLAAMSGTSLPCVESKPIYDPRQKIRNGTVQ
jgi:hypothetical protein